MVGQFSTPIDIRHRTYNDLPFGDESRIVQTLKIKLDLMLHARHLLDLHFLILLTDEV